MQNDDGLDRLFFELASESRLGILRALQARSLRMQELARKLNLTDTETCRQLQRLTEGQLIQKQPDGTYSMTPYGKLELELTSAQDFVHRNKDYFLKHDVFALPYEFVNRLGELSTGEFSIDALGTLNRVRQMVFEAEEYIWVIADEIDSSHVEITNAKVSEGLKLKFIMPKKVVQTAKFTPEMLLCPRCRKQIVEDEKAFKAKGCGYCERRQLEEICLSLFINEKTVCVSLRRIGDVMDYAAFFGRDEKFRKWSRDIFLHFWERAERW